MTFGNALPFEPNQRTLKNSGNGEIETKKKKPHKEWTATRHPCTHRLGLVNA